jgi:3-methyladenine DNA glycosylase AlkC
LSLKQGLLYLKKITEFFSAEFAIRHFIIQQPGAMLAILTTWLEHENPHVRRLISKNHPQLIIKSLAIVGGRRLSLA